MDPEATWCRLLETLESDQREEAAEAASNLLDWLSRGGFPPQVIPGRMLPEPWNRAVTRSACQFALQWANDRRG